MADKTFANGIIFAHPNDKAPEFIIGKISIKKSEFIPFLQSQSGDWVNLDVKLSKTDKIYCEVNNWKSDKRKDEPTEMQASTTAPEDNSSLPF